MTEEERLQWAKDAERNPAIWESFQVLKETYMRQASLCDPKDDLGRYRYLEAYKDIDVVITYNPCELIENPVLKKSCWNDFKNFKNKYFN